jgi:hypothetical protein
LFDWFGLWCLTPLSTIFQLLWWSVSLMMETGINNLMLLEFYMYDVCIIIDKREPIYFYLLSETSYPIPGCFVFLIKTGFNRCYLANLAFDIVLHIFFVTRVLYVCFVVHCLSFCTFSFGHCVVCLSSIYGFWLPLWYRIFKFFFISWIASLCQWSILYLELPPFVNVTYRILNCLPFFSYCKSAIGRREVLTTSGTYPWTRDY